MGSPATTARSLVLEADGHEVATGEEGLLYMRSVGLPGVWDAARRRESHAVPRARRRALVQRRRRGPLGCRPTATIYVGRRDRMVKRRGYYGHRARRGIERALYLHSRVREVAVISSSDEKGGIRIVACLASHDTRPSMIELKTFCASHLPVYMSPDRFAFLDRLRGPLPTRSTTRRCVGVNQAPVRRSRASIRPA